MKACGKSRSFGLHPAALPRSLYKAVAIENRMDRGFGRDADIAGQAAHE
jgi:hypothetical protein